MARSGHPTAGGLGVLCDLAAGLRPFGHGARALVVGSFGPIGVVEGGVDVRSIRTAAAVLVLATLTGGCGAYESFRTSDFAEQDGVAIATAARKAMQDVTSVRLTGQVVSNGNTVLLDLSLGNDRCTGTLRLGGSHIAIRRVGPRAWIKGDKAFVSSVATTPVPPAALTRLSTSWIPAQDKAILALCDMDRMLGSFRVMKNAGASSDVAATGGVTVGAEATVDGSRVVDIGVGEQETAWVLSEAPHYVIRVESAVPRDGGSLVFSEFNRDVRVEVPRRRDVFQP